MKNKQHTIKGIASELKVSITTVSFVLNGKAKEMRISEEVSKKILDYAKKIDYKPNQLAQSLRTGKSKIIVFMVEDISNHFFARLARIIEDIAYEKGYKVLFCSNDNESRKSVDLINLFEDRKVDGYIIIPSSGIEDKIEQLLYDKRPLVLFDRYLPDLETSYVIIDNENAAYNAAKHLTENSFRNIAFITTDVEQTQMLDRLNGYGKALQEKELKQRVLKIPYNLKSKERKDLIHTFLVANPEIDSVFFATNYLTQDGLAVIKENFPILLNQLGLLTFDDNALYEISTPSITAVSQPLDSIGQELMAIMFDMLTGEKQSTHVKKVVLNASLRIRNSSISKKLYLTQSKI